MTITGTPDAGTTSYTYDNAHQLTGYSAPTGLRTLAYDSNGNQTTDGNGSTYQWNSQNQLVGITGPAGSQSYQYNGDGIRTQVNGASQLWDTNSPLPLLISDGASTQTYAGTTLVAQREGGQAYFPLADALGSTRVVSTSGGTAVGITNFDAYGALRSASGQPSSFGFTGQQTDASGLLNLRARMYEPQNGRFLSVDPLIRDRSELQSGQGLVSSYLKPTVCRGTGPLSAYQYSGGRPTSLVDPTGMGPKEDLLADCILDCVKRGIERPGFNECIRDCNIFVEIIGPLLFVGSTLALARIFLISRGVQLAYR